MLCPTCQSPNPDGMKFCQNCGTPLLNGPDDVMQANTGAAPDAGAASIAGAGLNAGAASIAGAGQPAQIPTGATQSQQSAVQTASQPHYQQETLPAQQTQQAYAQSQAPTGQVGVQQQAYAQPQQAQQAYAQPQGQPYQQQGQPAYAQPQGQPYQQAQGQPYQQAPYGQQPGAIPADSKNKIAAGLLGIFLGALGIHKFYLGYTKSGVIMLLVTLLTLGIAGFVMEIIGIIEGILYLTKTDWEFYNTYVVNEKQWF